MSKKAKLLARVQARPVPVDFTWAEAVTLMKACGFTQLPPGNGSRRKFVHEQKRVKVSLHEPHPETTLKRYMVKELIEALRNAGELK